MSLKDINIKISYNSDEDNILDDFYIPALSESIKYKRIGGFFSSSTFAVASQGLSRFIKKSGKIQMIVNHELQEDDNIIINDLVNNPEKLEELLMNEIHEWDLENNIFKNHIAAFGWMLFNNKLELKIAIGKQKNLLHQKVGILYDEKNNIISFSGSNNESARGWKYNIEEFKVFCGWNDEQKRYLDRDIQLFEKYWNGSANNIYVFDLPNAVKNKIISVAPEESDKINIDKYPLKKLFEDRNNNKLTNEMPVNKSIFELRDYQKKAVKSWLSNNYKGILSMATGSGKTKTALSIVKNLFDSNKLICVIAMPYEHLVRQWIDKDIQIMFPGVPIIEVHGNANIWKKNLKMILPGFNKNGIKHIFIVGLYGSLASKNFIEILNSFNIDPSNFLYIADELHNAGAPESQNGLLDLYSKRIGLSATPSRHFDEEGTEIIIKYFNKIVFEYTIKDAIDDGYLTPYNYYPEPSYLSLEEYDEYYEISKKISRKLMYEKFQKENIFNNKNIKNLLLFRSRILKNAHNKIEVTKHILQKLILKYKTNLKHVLIYCDNKKQVESIQKILNEMNLLNHKITEDESSDDRDYLLKSFAKGEYQVLVAVKILDEGVDIPEAKIAIINASTTNSREYIQRRGRVLRKALDKKVAEIYDVFVLPPKNLDEIDDKIEHSILKKEFERIRDFVDTSENPSVSYEVLKETMKKYKIYL